jgi:hypothetical protein
MKLNLSKRLRYFYMYKKTLKYYKKDLKSKYNLEIDRLQRMWTVISIPKENLQDVKKYGHKYIDNEVENFIKETDIYFRQINIVEFIKIENIEIINPLEVGVVFSFKFLKPQKIFWTKLIGIISLIVLGILLVIIL